MNVNTIIEGILDREKEGTPPYLAKDDAGGRTSWGISERTHPEAWRPGPPTRDQARSIYLSVYVKPFFALQGVAGDALIVALVDDAVTSGVEESIRGLQISLGVTADGRLGPATLAAFRGRVQTTLLKQVVVARAIRLARIVQHRPSDLTNLVGWLSRVLSFLPETL
jgi:lysozyme family protein